MLRHLPNLLSALRLMAAPLAAGLLLDDHDSAALAVFVAASFSDLLDGYVARRWGFTSRFGAWLDPAADKLLMLLCFVALLRLGVAPLWLVALVLARDLGIALGAALAWALSLPLRIAPLLIGKAATAVQVAYIGVWLLLLAFDLESPPPDAGGRLWRWRCSPCCPLLPMRRCCCADCFSAGRHRLTAMVSQLVLPLEHRAAMTRADFIVAPGNAQAVALVDAWPGWTAPAAALHGPPASGKTHLAHIWSARTGATLIEAARSDRNAGRARWWSRMSIRAFAEPVLFALLERGAPLLLTGRTPPAQWPAPLPDLASRFRALVAFGLGRRTRPC